MVRGRKPIPTNLKVLSGAYEHNPDRRPENEPDSVSGTLVCPKHLEGLAAEKWHDVVGILTKMGLASPSWERLLESYAQTYANYRAAQDEVDRTGLVLTGEDKDGNTTVKRNPFSVELHKYRDALLKMEVEMGLTPSAKSRVSVDNQTQSEKERKFFG